MRNPVRYSIVISMHDAVDAHLDVLRKMDLDHDASGRLMITRGDALREARRLVQEDGFDRADLDLLPIYDGPLFVPQYNTNHVDPADTL